MSSVTLASPHPNVLVERDGHVVTVTIDRPESKNGCTGDMWVALGAIFTDIRYSGARAVLLTGANGEFCSGADLSGAGAATSEGAGPSGSMLDGMRVLADVVLSIHSCPIPVVAKVDGLCVGAGLGLALAADLTWCSDRARFSAITAKIVHGPEAFDLGLVNAVVPVAELDAATQEVVDAIAGGPPVALSLTKRELDNASSSSLAHALEAEAAAQSVNVQTDDMREALMAYIERRPPTFTGR